MLQRIGIIAKHNDETSTEVKNMDEDKRGVSESFISVQDEKTMSSDTGVRYRYSKKDRLKLSSIFKDMITTDKAITVDELMERFNESSVLKHLIVSLTPLQLTDKIRSLRKTYRRQRK